MDWTRWVWYRESEPLFEHWYWIAAWLDVVAVADVIVVAAGNNDLEAFAPEGFAASNHQD